jgi:cytosine/adenosine deaminase-related metal-dependent hydrolase
MNYPQYRRMRKLVHECCNYDNGNCILLDNGEECVCVQSISYSLLCKWFRCAVLPLDGPLETALRAATINPAQAVGLFDTLGSITEGKRADVLVLDETLHPEKIFIGGVQTK